MSSDAKSEAIPLMLRASTFGRRFLREILGIRLIKIFRLRESESQTNEEVQKKCLRECKIVAIN